VTKATTEALPRLTQKQAKWVVAYLSNGGNATKAAKAAGYKGSYRTLAVQGHENLKNPKIRAHLAAAMADHMTADEVLWRLRAMACSDIDDILDDEDPTQVDLNKAREVGQTHLIKEIETEETTDKKGNVKRKTKVKLHDAKDALKQLGSFHNLWGQRQVHEAGKGTGKIVVQIGKQEEADNG